MSLATELHPARLTIGAVEWSIEPCRNMAIFHEDNADDDGAEPSPNFILIDRNSRRLLLGGSVDSFMLGEVIVRLMRQVQRQARRGK